MTLIDLTNDFERYRLTVETRDGHVAQRISHRDDGVDVWQKWKRNRNLGQGAFGEVWQEAWEDDHGDLQYRAVKICSEAKMRAASVDYRRELAALAAFSRSKYASHFANLHGWWMDGGNLCVAMEYLRYGDLSKYAARSLAESEIKEIAENILQGLAIMHSEGFTHRDIKPQNILVCQKRPEFHRWWVKIADFGISKQISPNSNTHLHTVIGTRPYCAPEVLGHLDQLQRGNVYTSKVDMWSLGCVLFNLGSRGHTPFSDIDLMRYCEARVSFNPKHLPIHLSEAGIAFIKALLQVHPQQRPAAIEALQNRWFVGADKIGTQGRFELQPEMTLTHHQNFNSFLDSSLSQEQSSYTLIDAPISSLQIDTPIMDALRPEPTVRRPPSVTPTIDDKGLQDSDFPQSPERESKNKAAEPIPRTPEQLDAENLASLNAEMKQTVPGVVEIPTVTRFTRAAKAGNLKFVKSWTDDGGDIHEFDKYGWTAFHYAVRYGRLETAKWLVDQGVDIHKTTMSGSTPLDLTLRKGHLETVQWLSSIGTSIFQTGSSGWTALHAAVRYGYLELAEWLVDQGADVNMGNHYGYTPFQVAAKNNHLETAKWLVSRGANIHRAERDGATALHFAADRGHLEMTKWLVNEGADVHCLNKHNRTPSMLAEQKGHSELAGWLAIKETLRPQKPQLPPR